MGNGTGIDPTRRIAAWTANYLNSTPAIPPKAKRNETNMAAYFGSVTPLIAAMEGQVKQLLDLAGVSVAQYPSYLSFGRKLWKLTSCNEISGESAAIEAEIRIVLYVARGLTRSVLENIRTQVFNIAPPASP